MSVDRHIDDLGNRLSPRTPQMWKVDICDLGVTTLTPDSLRSDRNARSAWFVLVSLYRLAEIGLYFP
jgi:hypothetical protein